MDRGPGGLPSMGLHKVEHDRSHLAAAAAAAAAGSFLSARPFMTTQGVHPYNQPQIYVLKSLAVSEQRKLNRSDASNFYSDVVPFNRTFCDD